MRKSTSGGSIRRSFQSFNHEMYVPSGTVGRPSIGEPHAWENDHIAQPSLPGVSWSVSHGSQPSQVSISL